MSYLPIFVIFVNMPAMCNDIFIFTFTRTQYFPNLISHLSLQYFSLFQDPKQPCFSGDLAKDGNAANGSKTNQEIIKFCGMPEEKEETVTEVSNNGNDDGGKFSPSGGGGEADVREEERNLFLDESEIPDVVVEVEVEETEGESQDDNNYRSEEESVEPDKSGGNGVKVSAPHLGAYSIESLGEVKGAIQYYTGLQDKEHFDYVFACLGPAAFHLRYKTKTLTAQDEFLLLLMKLRLNKDDKELAMFFGISQSTAGRVFKTWLNFAYFQLKDLNIWSSRDLIDNYMPTDFRKKFPKTRVILDGTEIPVEKPCDPKDQSATWSNYKNHNTLKILVGISPRGDVSHISDAYGGAASDRQIVERSSLLKNNVFQSGDSIMADRGFIVGDLFCLQGVQVNVPTVMKGITQLPAEKVIRDRRIASKRVHVERVIGMAKHFRILKQELDHSYIPLGGRILFVCLSLTNFMPGIVNKDA
jgi:hypothetical protein